MHMSWLFWAASSILYLTTNSWSFSLYHCTESAADEIWCWCLTYSYINDKINNHFVVVN